MCGSIQWHKDTAGSIARCRMRPVYFWEELEYKQSHDPILCAWHCPVPSTPKVNTICDGNY